MLVPHLDEVLLTMVDDIISVTAIVKRVLRACFHTLFCVNYMLT